MLRHSHTETLGILKEAKAHPTLKVQGIQQVSDEQRACMFFFGYDCAFHAKCCVLKYVTQNQACFIFLPFKTEYFVLLGE